MKYFIFFAILSVLALNCGGSSNNSQARQNDDSSFPLVPFEGEVTWISSAGPPGESLHIAKTTSNGETSEITYLTDSTYNDYKPVISPDGTQIAFFRAYVEDENFFLWDTSICVMNADGSDFRELTGNRFMNTEPYWKRDGSNTIIWTRMVHSSEGVYGTYVYQTNAGAQPGDELQISLTNGEWVNSGLQDGRVFVSKDNAFHLMTPNPGGEPTYNEISYTDSYHYLHKLTISNDETKIAYMKLIDPEAGSYRGAEIIFADFDASVPSISNEFACVPKDASKFSWYVSISPDNQFILYAEDGRIMLFNIATEEVSVVSTHSDVEYRYPTAIGTSK